MPRPRKPTALKILEGDQPCRINRDEPSSPAGLGPMPDFVADDPDAAAAWSRFEAELGLIRRADSEVVALYCLTWSLYVRSLAEIEDYGLTITTKTTTKVNPAFAIRNQCQNQLAGMLAQFGMTPAARATLKVGPKTSDDPLLMWIAAKASHAQSSAQGGEKPAPPKAKAGKGNAR